MKVVLREDDSGVSEVVGTILILAMTVVLFSTIIVWVTSIPTPIAQTRVDIQSALTPVYGSTGTQLGDWVNLTHQGGESLPAASTLIYVVDQKASGGTSKTDIARLRPFGWLPGHVGSTGTAYGLLDGTDTSWDVGERFAYYSSNLSASDTITVTVVDISRGLVVWTAQLTPAAGTRPPVFLNVWASNTLQPTPSTPESGEAVYVFASVMDPDGYKDIKNVSANLTVLWGTPNLCRGWNQLYDDGSNGDQVAGDGIFTLARTTCLNADISWDGTLVLFNATDYEGLVMTTRMILHVIPGTGGNTGPGLNGTTGRPPYLLWNGNQGYNIFNLTQWSQWTSTGVIQPKPTRTFAGSETVVVVVGSLTLQDIFSADTFNLWDPFSGNPQQAVVYGSAKTVNLASAPSSLQAFSFYQFINGYYLYTYKFNLNPASGTANYYTFATAPHPPYYFYARYPLSMYMKASTGTVFSATDSINITSATGAYQQFPQLTTYKDAAFTQPSSAFSSTSTMYVKVSMLSADSLVSGVKMGNVMIQDFSGGTELWRAPLNGYQSNVPICPVSGACASGTAAISSSVSAAAYFFAVNLSRVNQDPWVPGAQHYSFGLSSFQDSDENYGTVSIQVVITAPLYKMDLAVGSQDATSNSWGTNNYLYYFQNYNGYDWWKSLRVDYCQGSGMSTSGLPGSGTNCPTTKVGGYVRTRFGNFFNDGTLGIAESISTNQGDALVLYRRGLDASGSVVYLPVFFAFANQPTVQPLPEACNALGVGDVTGVGAQSVICAGTDGRVWYYRNDGNWTFVWVDQTGRVGGTAHSITSISVGDFNGDGANDIAVVGSGGFVAWYPNLDKHGTFQSPGIPSLETAKGEYNVYGSPVQGNFLNTYPTASSPEILQEQTVTVPQQTGANPNTGFGTQGSWTSGTILAPATPSYQSSGGNPGGYVQIQTGTPTNAVPGAYWQEPFTTSGSQPFTANISLDYLLSANGATGAPGVTFSAYIESAAGAPTTTAVWSISYPSGTTAPWTHVAPVSIPAASIPRPGTYYVKIAMLTTCGTSACGTTTGGFDNVIVSWASTPGSTSALEHYWYLGTMPSNPSISFNFVLNAKGTYSTDFDNYTFAYSTNVVAGVPTTGTYTAIYPPTTTQSTNVTVATNPPPTTSVNVTMPATIQGLPVWIRVSDTNRVVGSTKLDNLTVSRLYIYTFTPSGSTVQQLSGPTTAVTSSSAGDQNHDGIWDLVVATSGGKVFLYLGSRPTGLQFAGIQEYATAGGVGIVSVKFANILGNVSKYGLQIVVSTGTTVVFVNPASPGTTFGNPIAVTLGTIQAMATGDVNGDGVDDVVVGTSNGYVLFYANFGNGYSWSLPVVVYNTGAQVYYNLAIGDAANNLYVGR